MTKRIKLGKRDFTSVVALLLKAGHVGHMIQLDFAVGNLFRTDVIWFPGLQILVKIKTNQVLQLQSYEGTWIFRKGKTNGWFDLSSVHGGPKFIQLLQPHYIKYLNDIMLGDKNAT